MLVLRRHFYRSVIRLVRTISNVRVRFAPSPTGYMHIGGLRTALINKLFALRHNGKFILRIEDTDQASAFEDIVRCLRWAGLDPDEGPTIGGSCEPYVQSQRNALHARIAHKLVEMDAAYHCFCSVDRLELLRNEQRRRGETPRYDNRCRTLTRSDVAERLRAGQSYAIRFKVPNKKTMVTDVVFGEVEFDMHDSEGDFILLKSDGMPVYHLANVVDDHYMDITHVIRGVEWLSSTPKHLLLYETLGWLPPQFAHLPLLLSRPLTDIADPGNIVPFDLNQMNRQNVYISPDILRLCGRVHFDKFAAEALDRCCRSHNTSPYTSCEFLSHVRSFLREHFPNSSVITESCTGENDRRLAEQLCALRGRVACFSDLVNPEHGFYFMWSPPNPNTCADLITNICTVSTVQLSEVVNFLDQVMFVLSSTDNSINFKKCIMDSCRAVGIKQPDAMRILRTCLSGHETGLPVMELIQLLNISEAISRIRSTRDEIMRNGDLRNRG
ncbi:Glutamate--tRNA ligase [Paragonimus heterotremus]|uniref:Nondiscriminating glutamyl-tRNA synthetase EARS2, mitochondrial n=1 Tax=Paragonimus heterotremus TaxID=100268 RepID=A0A8J4SVD7_9TREM|nr:Glutamate--tRNA ligase [Paragonimus heterotremus]